MKKGQIFAQPFIIIFALIVAVLVLAFGFKAVLDLQEKARFAELLDAQTEIQEVARTMYTLGVGSQRTLNLRVPKDLECFCFQDSSNTNLDQSNLEPCTENPANLKNTMQALTDKQLFITPSNKYPINKFTIINQLKPVSNPLCIQVISSRISITLTSEGSYVEVS